MKETGPPPGFYNDPSDTSDEARYWDGENWSDHYAVAEPSPGPGIGNLSDLISDIPEQLKTAYTNNKDMVQTVGGGALIADGFIGFGKNREGIGQGFHRIIFGTIFLIAGIFFSTVMSTDNIVAPVNVVAVVTEAVYDIRTDTCQLRYSFVADGDAYLSSTGYGTTTFCVFTAGDTVNVEYEESNPVLNQLTSDNNIGAIKYIMYGLVVSGSLIAFSGAWLIVVRGTQIGAGIAIIANARKKREAKKII